MFVILSFTEEENKSKNKLQNLNQVLINNSAFKNN